MKARYPYEPWKVTETGFDPAWLRENESVFALGNGLLGLRGNLEEETAAGAQTIEGTFLNGVFDTEPITYGEGAYGYAKNHETICNVMDAKSLIPFLNGERLDLGVCDVSDHKRVLDLQKGTLTRSLRWRTEDGDVLRLEAARLVSLTHPNLAYARMTLHCEQGRCTAEIVSPIHEAVINAGDPNDPRNAAGKDRSMRVTALEAAGDHLLMQQQTRSTDFSVTCAVKHATDGESSVRGGERRVEWIARKTLRAGESLTVTKAMAYLPDTKANAEAALLKAREIADGAPAFEAACTAQAEALARFWAGAGLEIRGDDALLQGLHFNLFQLLASAGRDGKRNIAAKGITGEGYEGHYFWDTEAYILPVFMHTEPDVARKLLEYRYSILPAARRRAAELGHPGALFAWRTIDGEECSAYYPAGTAQYHIDGDIAHAVWSYHLATGDDDFMVRFGCEILAETARFFYDLGFFSAAKDGRFVINCVTGPDEYNVLVNNNVYTNRIAAETLVHAAEAMAWLRKTDPAACRALCARIGYTPAEGERWREAAERMYYPPKQNGLIPQDDEFLNRKPWPLDSIPPEKHPLLIHYHGLNIYRAMVCKQADLILAMTLFGGDYTMQEKRDNFFFYDSVTTHDSSLSMAVFSMLAAEIGEITTAYDYFMSSARMDLDDMHHNAKDGLHMANMAGTWNGITRGFGGMRVTEAGLSFRPVCPPDWEGYSFRVRYRGRTVQVDVDRAGAACTLVTGAPLTVTLNGRPLQLSNNRHEC